jgi:hypothetical protein
MKRLLTDQRGIATILIVVFVVLGVIVVGVVGTAVVVLSDNVKITVKNSSCGTLDIAKGTAAENLTFIPGINLPSQIAMGETAVVQLPKRLIESASISSGSVRLVAMGRSFTFGTSSLNMQRSTLDGTALSGFVGRQIDLSKDHTLVLECK